MDIFGIEIELDPKILVLVILLSGIFIVMIWKVPTWESYPFKEKMIITIVLPIVSYFVVQWQMNK